MKPRDVFCVRCGAKVGESCHTASTHRMHGFHAVRIALAEAETLSAMVDPNKYEEDGE